MSGSWISMPARFRRRLALAAWLPLVLQLAACAGHDTRVADEPLYPAPEPAGIQWYDTLVAELEPLVHERGDRWPLVLWRGVGFESLDPEGIRALLDRGIVQHLRLRRTDAEAAAALAAAGAPIILMEGAGGAWPYDTIRNAGEWRLRFPPDVTPRPAWRELADPTRLAGWEQARELTRVRLRRYAARGINIDAVWLDYEGALLHDDYQAVRASTAAAALPDVLLEDERRYRDYRRTHWLNGLSRYLAAPVRRVFPDAAVTNWVVMISSANAPVLGWTDWPHPPTPPVFFTHSNPVAYGIDTYFLAAWPTGHTINRENVDRFYTHLVLRQVSMDALNRTRYRPDMGAVVWVARWVPDHPDERVPVMSRAAYREALRHIWLRGADAMQVFNPTRKGFERYAVWEVEDVQRVYGEMLAYREFLEHGEVMNFAVPDNRDGSTMWSGLRLGDRALVRITNLGTAQRQVNICLTEERCIDLPVPRRGRTRIVELKP
ncbi:MAG: hypothetical protein U5R46_14290 [Gammaproteobacteria bacterium]|nr:hypothetical protein [Gammaproteobacteria bacterium]